MKNSYKLLFFLVLIIGSLISISASSWFSVWMGLEINLLSFIPLMMNSKNLFSSEASLKYFLTQALASTLFLFLILLFLLFLNFKTNFMIYFNMLISSTMMMKMGAAPFHFWFPSVMEGLNWYSNMILMTWQKIAPLMILSYCLNLNLLIISIIFSAIFGGLGGLNQTSLQKVMAFSSINHLSWMMAGMIFQENLWLIYYLFYILLSVTILMIFNGFKLFNINQMFSIFNHNIFTKILIFSSLLSMGGLPPFLGFFPKWMIIEMLIFMSMNLILLILLFFTLITLYFYMRISYTAMLMNYWQMNWNYKISYTKKNMIMLLNLSFLSIFGLTLINFIYMNL